MFLVLNVIKNTTYSSMDNARIVLKNRIMLIVQKYSSLSEIDWEHHLWPRQGFIQIQDD